MVKCLADAREPGQVAHTVELLLRQRVYGLALGYEDLDDHEELRTDAPPAHRGVA